MPKKVHSRSTKAEILEAYKELEIAYQELEAKKGSSPPVAAATKTPETAPAKSLSSTKETSRPQTSLALSLPKEGNAHALMEEVINGLGKMGEKFNTALSQLSSNLLVEASRLKTDRTTVDTESNRLATLYNLKIEENTLTALLKEYSETAEQYIETSKQKREELEKAWWDKNQAWETEIEETTSQLQELENALQKNQKREENEYRYDLTLKRNLNDEDYTQEQQTQQQVIDELQETRHKTWEEREKALAEREKQFEENKTKVERFPKELESAIKKAKEEGIGIGHKQAKIKADLAAKEFSGEEEVYQLKIRELEEQVANQGAQLEKLSKQLESALKQAQELAVKAIEGASNKNSYNALKDIALEQAKNLPKSK
jgi:DNA repair exonuclease SbcCD ATPase subunit